jgi:uncharacterized protein YggL (DUF469 family)
MCTYVRSKHYNIVLMCKARGGAVDTLEILAIVRKWLPVRGLRKVRVSAEVSKPMDSF